MSPTRTLFCLHLCIRMGTKVEVAVLIIERWILAHPHTCIWRSSISVARFRSWGNFSKKVVSKTTQTV